MQDAKDLVNEAHKLGIYVILDGVFGHHKSHVVPSPKGVKPQGVDRLLPFPESLEFYKNVVTWWIDELEIDGWRFDQSYQLSTLDQDRNYYQDIRKEVEKKCEERKNQGKKWEVRAYMVGNHDLVRLEDLIQRAPYLEYGKENDYYWKRHKIVDLISNDVIECFEDKFKIHIDGLSARFLKLE
jgi:glycosidase